MTNSSISIPNPMNLASKCFPILALLVAGCVSAPLDFPKETSVAITDTAYTGEAAEVERWMGGEKPPAVFAKEAA